MRILRHGLAALLLAGCGPQTISGPTTPDDFSPGLSKFDQIFHGTPKNGSLPNLGKADDVYPAQSTELVALQSPVKDQNRRGVCTIFTTTGLMEHLYLKAGMQSPSFSEQYLQWAVKVQLGVLPDYEGSNISDNVQAIHQFGIVDEATDPYNGLEWTAADDPACVSDGSETQTLPARCWTQGDPPQAAQQAQKYTLPAGRFINSTDVKAHITQNHTAVGAGIEFFYQAWNHGLSTLPINRADLRAGIVRYPNATDVTESRKAPAGHGILIVGWDDNLEYQQVDDKGQPMVDGGGNPVMEKGFYIFKNSWGTDIFGVTSPYGAGFGVIAERYVTDFASAYVTDVPSLAPPPPPPPACDYHCADYGFAPSQCYAGWTCDVAGQCLSYTGGC